MSFPRIDITEIDLSQPTQTAPVFAGTPAAVIGTAQGGRAFIPTRLNSLKMYKDNFGDISSKHYGSVAVRAWYSEAEADASLVYIRLLGVGKGEKRTTNNRVLGAGFVVGDQQVQSRENRTSAFLQSFALPTVGSKTHNPFANQVTMISTYAQAIKTLTVGSRGMGGGDSMVVTDGHGGTLTVTIGLGSYDADIAVSDVTVGGSAGAYTYAVTYNVSGVSSNALFAKGLVNSIIAAAGTATPLMVTATAWETDATTIAMKSTAARADGGTKGNACTVKAVNSGGTFANDVSLTNNTAVSFASGQDEIETSSGLGRTYFLSCFMSQSAGSTYFDDAGIRGDGKHTNILRACILVASGVEMALSGWNPDADMEAYPFGTTGQTNIFTGSAYAYGSYGFTKNAGNTIGAMYQPENAQSISFIFNGMKSEVDGVRIMKASLNPGLSSSYLPAVLNTDPTQIEKYGHYLYAHYPVPVGLAIPTPLNRSAATGGILKETNTAGTTYYHNVLLHTGSVARNTYSSAATYAPNFEGWEDRFSTPFTPWIVSQPIGGEQKRLFRLHCLDDGEGQARNFYGIVNNVTYPRVDGEYGSFDLQVWQYGYHDSEIAAATSEAANEPGARPSSSSDNVPFITYSNISLDPNAPNYIAKIIGDTHIYYDFEQNPEDQKIVKSGLYPNSNAYIRVEVHDDVANGVYLPDTIPFGFQGIRHLVTSGSAASGGPFSQHEVQTCDTTGNGAGDTEILNSEMIKHCAGAIMPPLPFRETIQKSSLGSNENGDDFPWGVRFDIPRSQHHYKDENGNTWTATTSYDESLKVIGNSETNKWDLVRELTKFYPSYQGVNAMWVGENEGTAEHATGGILDASVFNNNGFSLSKLLVNTHTVSGNVIPNNDKWGFARYIRTGVDPSESDYRFMKASDLRDDRSGAGLGKTSFCFPFQGGFDGLNIFDVNASKMNNFSAHYQQENVTAQGGKSGATTGPYRKAIDILSEKTDVDISALCVPDQRCSFITDYAISKMEERFDAMAIIDPEIMDSEGSTVSNILFDSLENHDGTQKGFNAFYSAERFGARGLDSSFGAAYFPNVDLAFDVGNPNEASYEDMPGSIAALAAFARAKRKTGDHGVPAGYDNGKITAATATTGALLPDDVKELYSVGINAIVHHTDASSSNAPITATIDNNIVIFGQKTLLRANTVMSRLDVRKLLIAIRRATRRIAEGYLFEPNQPSVLAKFSAEVDSYLAGLQVAGALRQYRVVIDDTTTSQADIENNTVRGKVFVQPEGSVEIVSIDLGIVNDFAD